ncbi:P-loop NTPase family protein [Aliiglaciecola lipolytica]|uniref:AAA domain-containing protein n=1 Tax=Aliiglaciecola lipolytica E3 TaxID=1127673 RepID=K6WZ32_9ALTE|nr:hypothetical protein [Aliiglaciecola lipolytica]GAC13709.1 hypothetical protein GLIP_1067 [Aliiglaciecola lipolytica E3]
MASKLIGSDSLNQNAAYQHVRLRLLSEGMLGKPDLSKVIGLMARSSGEGVTTTAVGLALAINARSAGSVLLIDANPSSQRVSDLLDCKAPYLQANDVSSDNFNIDNYIVHAGEPALNVLSLAKLENSQTCSSSEFSLCWETLKKRYDTIIMDIGAWSTEAPLGWIEQVDDLILVLDGNHTTREMLSHFNKTIDRCGCKLSGFIMNKHERPIPDFVYKLIS